MTVELLLLLLIALLLAANLVVTFLTNERIRNAILKAAREARERGLRNQELRIREMAASMELSRDEVPACLQQIILDVTGERVLLAPHQPYVDEGDVPSVVAIGGDGLTRYIFVPEPCWKNLRLRERHRVYRVDAYTSDPLSPFLLRKIYGLLQEGVEKALPRCSSWMLVVTPSR